MSEAVVAKPEAGRERARAVLPAVAGAALLVAGLAGGLSEAWGYALFLLSAVVLVTGVSAFAVLAFSGALDARRLARASRSLLRLGGWAYVYSLCAFAGYFVRETLEGRMELRWILFGPAVLSALIALDWGLYRKLVANNLPAWRRYAQHLTREASQPQAMRSALLNDVLLQRALWRTSRLRWVRHTLMFWGFGLMFATELVAVLFREALPAFGWPDLWRTPGHPVRLALGLAFDFSGAMMLAGCLLALAWRAMANDTPERKYADTPSAVFLLFVVASGFLLEAMRIAANPGDPSTAASFAGRAFAALVGNRIPHGLDPPLWLVHVLGACLFIGYVPVRRLVHSCATPVGRLMNSQKELLAAKRRAVLGGLMTGTDRSRKPWGGQA